MLSSKAEARSCFRRFPSSSLRGWHSCSMQGAEKCQPKLGFSLLLFKETLYFFRCHSFELWRSASLDQSSSRILYSTTLCEAVLCLWVVLACCLTLEMCLFHICQEKWYEWKQNLYECLYKCMNRYEHFQEDILIAGDLGSCEDSSGQICMQFLASGDIIPNVCNCTQDKTISCE